MNILPRPRQPGETIFAYLLLLFSLFVFWEAYKISGFSSASSAGVFPMCAAAVMLFASVLTIVRTQRATAYQREPGLSKVRDFRNKIVPANIIVFVALLVAYTIALDAAGFLLSSFLFLFLSIAYLYRRGPLVALLIAAGGLVVIYVVFRMIFTVVLPKGWLFQ
ncbi:tripartite tricarboxylate transporter TctB family protein [Microvirga lenta]|uniref:tripartite tricarboxylate transporter TctB family protein n=1 Tax=Microvirga lenta TaxID=2881337 RepID=UPI001CFDA879|nr:tripartite tricarboxylate transporter TctB family protein [Microvirga lenta]MCB5174174.1 tripartite tricarboxylate transporter TctB family protein [Microvirga lenta]